MKRIVVIAVADALGSSIALPAEMLRAAAQHARARQRERERQATATTITVAAEHAAPVRMSGLLNVLPDTTVAAVAQADLVIVPSLWRTPSATVQRHPQVCAALTRLAAAGAAICSVGTGSYFAAAAGLLDGRPATTHWSFFADFARRFPRVELRRRHLITRSGPFFCAGSINSAADLMIHFIGELFDADAARQVESQFSPEIRRPFAAHSFVDGERSAHPDEAIWMAQDWIRAHLDEPLRMPRLAAEAGLSTRSFNRRFRAATGTSPARFVQDARIASGRDLLRNSNLAIGEIAQRCGFANGSHFSRAFAVATGASPQAYRQRVRGKLFLPGD